MSWEASHAQWLRDQRNAMMHGVGVAPEQLPNLHQQQVAHFRFAASRPRPNPIPAYLRRGPVRP